MAGRKKRRTGASSAGGAINTGAARQANVAVRSAKGRKIASTRWLARQFNDPYVAAARNQGYRGRAAFKLIGIDDKFRLIRPGLRIVDLGCAPGSWSQVALARSGGGDGSGGGGGEDNGHPATRVVGIDLRACETLPGALFLEGDFREENAQTRLRDSLGGAADLVLSDMAANATGQASVDHLRVTALAEAAFEFAVEVLNPGGGFVCKVFSGGTEAELLRRLKQDFARVSHIKPAASRKESAERYVVAQGFRRPREPATATQPA